MLAIDDDDEKRRKLTICLLKDYIDTGGLLELMKTQGRSFLTVTRFESLNKKGIVRMFVCGRCAGCPAPHIRNICATQFCNLACDAIKQCFPSVKRIIPVTTHDPDFERIANKHGGKVIKTMDGELLQSIYTLKKLMLDWHPDIDCFIKILSRRNEGGEKEDDNMMISFDELRHTYNACFVCNSMFKINDIHGNVAINEECLQDNFSLPEYMIEKTDSGSPYPIVMSYNPNFFNVDQYVNIVFDSNY